MDEQERDMGEVERAFASLAAALGCRFQFGDRVEKTKGSSWHGRVVGFYSTSLTPVGYTVESERTPGSVQVYPEAALRTASLPADPSRDRGTVDTSGAGISYVAERALDDLSLTEAVAAEREACARIAEEVAGTAEAGSDASIYVDDANTLSAQADAASEVATAIRARSSAPQAGSAGPSLAEAIEALRPFAQADRAIGDEPGPFRFETLTGYRLIERDDLRRARSIVAAADAREASAAPPPAGETAGGGR